MPPNKPRRRQANAFRHASGIHQDGVIKFRENYEVIDPASVGRNTEIVLGKLSGRAGFVARVYALGIELPADGLDAAFDRFQALANHKPLISDEDLKTLL